MGMALDIKTPQCAPKGRAAVRRVGDHFIVLGVNYETNLPRNRNKVRKRARSTFAYAAVSSFRNDVPAWFAFTTQALPSPLP